MLNFRDSFTPYIGLILFIVCVIAVLLVCAFVHTKKVIYWAVGNMIGFFIGYMIAIFAGASIAKGLGFSIKIDFTDSDKISELVGVIATPVIILITCVIWNILVVVPVYFFFYKKWIGIHDINKYTDEIDSHYFHHKKGLLWSEKLAGIIFSLVAFYPPITMISSDADSYLCAKANGNKADSAMSYICSWNGNVELRENMDAAQAIINFTNNDLDKNLYSTGSNNIYYNYITSLGKLLFVKDDSTEYFTSTLSNNWFLTTPASQEPFYSPNYMEIFDNDIFSKYVNYLFESRTMIDVVLDSLTNILEGSVKIDSGTQNTDWSLRIFPFLAGNRVSISNNKYVFLNNDDNVSSLTPVDFDYFAGRLSSLLFTNPDSENSLDQAKKIAGNLFSIS